MANFLWTERTDFGPGARRGMAMAYDSVRGVTVMFGGDAGSGGFLGDTWEWDGDQWVQVSDMGPAARSHAGMAFATDEKACVLFGGKTSAGQPFGDTWRWDGTAWTELLNFGPAARNGAGMAFDSNRNRVVLFGGLSSSGPFGDTWEFDGRRWTELKDTGPSARSGLSMAFDDTGKRIVLFGGLDGSGKTCGDTWAWDGQRWVQIADLGPAARFNAAMSGGQGSMVLMGGVIADSVTQVPSADTWQLSGNLWTQSENIGPGSLSEAASVVDSGRNVVVLFGGVTNGAGGLSGNTWEGSLPAPPLAVLSAALRFEADELFTVIALNGPAPAGGISVNVSLTKEGQTVIGSPVQLSAAPGQTTVGTFSFAPTAGTYTLTAQIPGTLVVSGSITI